MRSLADGDHAGAAVAARLAPYPPAGAQQLNITACVPSGQDAIALAGQIKAELLS